MIAWSDFYSVMSAVVPLYVAMILAYGSVRWWEIFSPEQCAGINRFVAVFAIPLLSFHFLAANDPYNMNFRFLAADTLQKIVILVALVVWAHFSRRADIMDWLITIFSISTLPNTLIMGIPLLDGMYGKDASALMIQVVVLQCIIWYTLLLFLFEYRDAMKLIREQFPESTAAIASLKVESDVVSLAEGEAEVRVDYEGRIHVTVRKSTSTRTVSPHRSPFTPQPSNLASGELLPVANSPINLEDGPNFCSGKITRPSYEVADAHKFARSTSAPPSSELWGIQGQELSFAGDRGGAGLEEGERASNFGRGLHSGVIGGTPGKQMPPASVLTKIILNMVWRKLVRNPNTYSSILGLVWSLIEFRFHVKLPAIIANSISILSDAGLGMAMFSLGLFMALQPKLIACGNWVALFSMAVRFVFGPAVMTLVSLAVGLRGDLFRIAVVQAALPQGVVPFVFAKEYNNHPTILSTGVIFGLLVALPIDLIYYFLLEL